jgi:threonine aldolase
MPPLKDFASDNTAGMHPAVLDALARANPGRAPAYGDDELTARAVARLRAVLDAPDAAVFFVWGGTAANVLGLQAVLAPHEAVVCTDVAHIEVDECGAPERFAGSKLLPVRSQGGKLTAESLLDRLGAGSYPHHVAPRVVSITQSTEYGTVYTPAELGAIAAVARAHRLRVHMDGARLANAAATLGLPLRAITRDVGVDVLSFGATKNGAMAVEAVVCFDPALAADFPYIRKQGMHLASKMRFAAAQFDALLQDDLWLRNARHANAMARRLAQQVSGLDGITLTQPVEANAVFAVVPPDAVTRLQAEYRFYVWNDRLSEVRWMTAFDTTPEDVDAFASAIRDAVAQPAGR